MSRLCVPRTTAATGRPRIRLSLALLLASIAPLGLALAPSASARGRHRFRPGVCRGAVPVNRSSARAIRRSILCLVNRERRFHGLPRLRELRRLDFAAQEWTGTMVATGRFAHSNFIGARISAAGYPWRVVGENIASGFATPAGVVRAWMRSVSHCHNILDPRFSDLGTGIDPRPVGYGSWGHATWTIDFGLPFRARQPSRNWGPADGCPYAG